MIIFVIVGAARMASRPQRQSSIPHNAMLSNNKTQTNSLKHPTPTLRAAAAGDAQKLAEIVHLAYRGGLSPVAWKNENHLVSGPRATAEDIDQILESADKIILIAEILKADQADVVGCVQIEDYGQGEAHIGLLTVRPDCQNLGLGKLLVQAAEEYARQHWQSKTATMSVLYNRAELLDWYLRLGYALTGETAPFVGVGTGLTTHFENPHFVVISKDIG